MKRPSQIFSEEDRNMIREAVQEAERGTSGEIVPLVAAASGRYDRAEDLFGLLTALALLAALWLLFQDARPAESPWRSGFEIHMSLAAVIAVIVAGFALGSASAALWPRLKMPFVRPGEMEAEIQRAAAAAFHRFRVGRAADDAGILIYVSCLERRVRVEGGRALSGKLSDEQWREVCRLAAEGLKAGRPAEGLCAAIRAAGELLARQFPIQPGDKNELNNDLTLIDEAP